MSINDFMNKIKGQLGIDVNTLLILLILVLVGVGSFGLGRLSLQNNLVGNDIKLEYNKNTLVKGEIGNREELRVEEIKEENFTKEKMYVASKNGKLYYNTACSGAKRIKSENQLWFSSSSEAEDSGFTLATSCK